MLSTLDDFDTFGVENKKLCNLWADTLFQSDHMGNYSPWLATDWSWSPDNLECTIHIRSDVLFQNGDVLTAKDVEFSFERILTQESLRNSYRWVQKLNRVEMVDPDTVVFYFIDPMPNFYAEASSVPILCARAYDSDPNGFFTSPIASGPYRVIETDFSNSRVVFGRWDEWWGWTPDNKSNIDRIIYQEIPDPARRVSSVQIGQIDIAENLPLESLVTLENADCKVFETPYFQNEFIILNCDEDSVFSDMNVRKALSLCLDRQLIVDNVIGGGTVSTWPFPPGVVGYRENSTGYAYDPENARRLLQASEYQGEALTMIVPSGFIVHSAELSRAIQAMAAQTGFNINIALLSNDIYDQEKFSGNYDLCLSNFVYIQGESLLPVLEVLRPSFDVFHTGYENPLLEELISQASVTVDPLKRQALLEQSGQMIMDQFAPCIYLYNESYALSTVRSLSNFILYPDGLMELRYLQKN
jgi:peptide/nickel transport system substrate-binding protein